jgi:hypothetical protein
MCCGPHSSTMFVLHIDLDCRLGTHCQSHSSTHQLNSPKVRLRKVHHPLLMKFGKNCSTHKGNFLRARLSHLFLHSSRAKINFTTSYYDIVYPTLFIIRFQEYTNIRVSLYRVCTKLPNQGNWWFCITKQHTPNITWGILFVTANSSNGHFITIRQNVWTLDKIRQNVWYFCFSSRFDSPLRRNLS